MFKPGIDDLVFVGFAQATPTLFPFVEAQARLLGGVRRGRYAPAVASPRWSGRSTRTTRSYIGHVLDRPRHTQQVDYFIYEHDMRTKEIPSRPAPGRRQRRQLAGEHDATSARHAATAGVRRCSRRSTTTCARAASTSINIADISRRAGVTRSAFYFYFENKASAVAALMNEMYDEAFDGRRPAPRRRDSGRRTSRRWCARSSPPGTGTSTCSERSLDARATSTTVRELWDSDRESFVPVVADMIETERASGAAPAGADATSLASVLLELNDRMLERLALGGALDREQLVEAVVAIWLHTIYGEWSPHEPAEQARRGHLHLRRASSCDGWHFTGAGDALDSDAGRPVVVMAHGLGGTKDSGLEPFATALAEAGLDVLAFDYRGFGASRRCAAAARQMAGQLEDYRAAMAAAARLPGVDRDPSGALGRVVSGGHVLAAAVGRDDVAAVVSLAPLVDGLAAGRLALKHHPSRAILRSTAAGFRSRVSSLRGGEPVMMPIVARPGELGALTLSGTLRVLPRDRRPHLAQRDRRLGRPRARLAPPGAARQVTALPGARADRRLRPQRPAAGVRQGGRGGPSRGPALPVRPLRRLARQPTGSTRSSRTRSVPAPAPRRQLRRGCKGYPGTRVFQPRSDDWRHHVSVTSGAWPSSITSRPTPGC